MKEFDGATRNEGTAVAAGGPSPCLACACAAKDALDGSSGPASTIRARPNSPGGRPSTMTAGGRSADRGRGIASLLSGLRAPAGLATSTRGCMPLGEVGFMALVSRDPGGTAGLKRLEGK